MTRHKAIGYLFALIVLPVWGATFVSTKALLSSGLSALEVLVYRYLLGYVSLWIIHPKPARAGQGRCGRLFAIAGFAGVTSYQLLENIAIHYASASIVSVVVSTCPMFTALLSRIVLKDKALNLSFAAGFAVAILGISIICMEGAGAGKLSLAGIGLALLSAISWAVYSVSVTKINSVFPDSIAATRKIFLWALLFTLPVIALGKILAGSPLSEEFLFSLDPRVLEARLSDKSVVASISFLGFFASALCFALWNRVCAILGTVKATVGIYLVPVFAVVFANVFLSEKISLAAMAGGAITVIGVAISGRK